MKNIRIAALSIVALTCLTTLFIRIPLPSRGYFNVGDMAVVFGGLVLGFIFFGAVAGGGTVWMIRPRSKKPRLLAWRTKFTKSPPHTEISTPSGSALAISLKKPSSRDFWMRGVAR